MGTLKTCYCSKYPNLPCSFSMAFHLRCCCSCFQTAGTISLATSTATIILMPTNAASAPSLPAPLLPSYVTSTIVATYRPHLSLQHYCHHCLYQSHRLQNNISCHWASTSSIVSIHIVTTTAPMSVVTTIAITIGSNFIILQRRVENNMLKKAAFKSRCMSAGIHAC